MLVVTSVFFCGFSVFGTEYGEPIHHMENAVCTLCGLIDSTEMTADELKDAVTAQLVFSC